jgi:hypothetical protein
MINWNNIKNVDVKNLDPTKIDLTRFDVRNIDLPKFDVPNIDLRQVDLPKFEVPTFEMPAVDLPELPVDVDRLAGFARDAAYAGVGAAVVTVKKFDEQRREMTDQVTSQVRKLVDAVA